MENIYFGELPPVWASREGEGPEEQGFSRPLMKNNLQDRSYPRRFVAREALRSSVLCVGIT